MNRVKKSVIGVIAILSLIAPLPSYAVKANVVMEMEDIESARFTSGMVMMLQYLQYRLGKPERGECIYNWYFKDQETPAMVVEFFDQYPDKEAEAIVYVLAKKACFNNKE